MWAGPLHNTEFLERLQATVNALDETIYPTRPRMQGMLNLASEVRTRYIGSDKVRNWKTLFTGRRKNSLKP